MSTSRKALMSPTGMAFSSDHDLMIHIKYGLFVNIVTLFHCYRLRKNHVKIFCLEVCFPRVFLCLLLLCQLLSYETQTIAKYCNTK